MARKASAVATKAVVTIAPMSTNVRRSRPSREASSPRGLSRVRGVPRAILAIRGNGPLSRRLCASGSLMLAHAVALRLGARAPRQDTSAGWFHGGYAFLHLRTASRPSSRLRALRARVEWDAHPVPPRKHSLVRSQSRALIGTPATLALSPRGRNDLRGSIGHRAYAPTRKTSHVRLTDEYAAEHVGATPGRYVLLAVATPASASRKTPKRGSSSLLSRRRRLARGPGSASRPYSAS